MPRSERLSAYIFTGFARVDAVTVYLCMYLLTVLLELVFAWQCCQVLFFFVLPELNFDCERTRKLKLGLKYAGAITP